jgi:hypothetical protein
LHSSDIGEWTAHQPFIDFKKVFDSIRKEVLYRILIEFGVHIKLVRLIKICLNEKYGKVRISKYLSDNFPTENGLKQGDAVSPLFLNLLYNTPLGKFRKSRRD